MSHKSIESQGYTPTESLDSQSEKKKLSKKAKVGMAVAGLVTAGSVLAGCGSTVEAKGPAPDQTQSQESDPTAEITQSPEVDPLSPEAIEDTPFNERTPEQLELSYNIPVEEYADKDDKATKIAEQFLALDEGYANSGNNEGMDKAILEQINQDPSLELDEYVDTYLQDYNSAFENSSLFVDGWQENKPEIAAYIDEIEEDKLNISTSYKGHSLEYADDYEIKTNGYETYNVEKSLGNVDVVKQDEEAGEITIYMEYSVSDNADNLIPTEGSPDPDLRDGLSGNKTVSFKQTEIDGKKYWQVYDLGNYGEGVATN